MIDHACTRACLHSLHKKFGKKIIKLSAYKNILRQKFILQKYANLQYTFTYMCMYYLHRQLAPGMEEHVPVLFLDLNDDLLTPCDDDPVCAVRTGELFAEKEETMIELPIIKRDDTQVGPVCALSTCVYTDMSVHYSVCMGTHYTDVSIQTL